MEQTIKAEIANAIQTLRLPHYWEIPSVGLFLDQTAKYVSEYLKPLQDASLTGSMISNYVKKGLLSNPVKKQYSREQIAVAVKYGQLIICGCGLELSRMHREQLVICGQIESVRLVRRC